MHQCEMINAPRAYEFGSAAYLAAFEKHFGGYQSHIPYRTMSLLRPDADHLKRTSYMVCGDRMFRQGYAASYANCLQPYLERL